MNHPVVIWPVHIPACEHFLLSSLVTLSGAVAWIPDLHDDRDDGHPGFLVVRRLRERLAGHRRGQVSCEAELCCPLARVRVSISSTLGKLKKKCSRHYMIFVAECVMMNETPSFCAPLYEDCVIQCQTAAKSESTPLLSPSTSIRMSLSLTRASTCSTEPSLQRAVSKIWCFHSTVAVWWSMSGLPRLSYPHLYQRKYCTSSKYMLPVYLQPVPASFAVEMDAVSLWGRCVMEWKTAQMDGTRLDAVSLLPEDTWPTQLFTLNV